jgi:hypothetical protein
VGTSAAFIYLACSLDSSLLVIAVVLHGWDLYQRSQTRSRWQQCQRYDAGLVGGPPGAAIPRHPSFRRRLNTADGTIPAIRRSGSWIS